MKRSAAEMFFLDSHRAVAESSAMAVDRIERLGTVLGDEENSAVLFDEQGVA